MAKLFPYIHQQNFLSNELSQEILNYGIRNERNFTPSTIYSKEGGKVSDLRKSLTLMDLGDFRDILQQQISSIIPQLIGELALSSFVPGEIELQLAAHGDGAFFGNHIDTLVHHKANTPRVISAVYYLHSHPKKFDGGVLRLYPVPFGDGDDQPVDISPDHNSLLSFPSFAPHEVLPVEAPGVEFKDWRFAVNCWVHRA